MEIGSKIEFDIAYAATMQNTARTQGNTRNDGQSGFERSHTGGFADIRVTPKFKIDKRAKFFTIGSCFARNIEFHLERMGVNVITTKFTVPGELYELAGLGARNGALNAYTPASMSNLINLPSREDAARCGLIQIGEDEFCDMLVTGIRPVAARELNVVRKCLLDAYAALPTADVVIVTLGFTESWFDHRDDMFVNRSPAGSRRTMREKDRFSFFNAGPNDTFETVEKIVADIRRVTQDKANIIISVSPVPIHATFTDRDVISANAYSKSTLLSAAVAVASKYSFVDYYPSYEMVTMSEHSGVWDDDGIHVRESCVDKVIRTFADRYF